MSSLTPAERNAEATHEAMVEGSINGLMTLIPSTGIVYYLQQNSKRFLARTNMQSRTALAIMPALFVFAWTAEEKLTHKMKEIAKETEHSQNTVRWAEDQRKTMRSNMPEANNGQADTHLMELYRKSVENSGVRIVPGDELGLHHRMANFVAANPLKFLIGMAVPSVGLIFWGNTGKEHLQPSVKLLHTRVFGQFATLSLLLGVMGFKEYMDQQGKFITQAEADERVEEMRRVREMMLERLEYENRENQKRHDKLVQAHNEMVEDQQRAKQHQVTPVAGAMTATSAK